MSSVLPSPPLRCHRHGIMPRLGAKSLVGAALFLCWGITSYVWLSHLIGGLSETIQDGRQPQADTSHAPSHHNDVRYPIYVAKDSSSGKFAISEWNDLSRRWHSNSTYTELLDSTRPVETLPAMPTSTQTQHSERVIFILHTHPKMASTTLRRACWENLRTTCDVVSPKRDPVGYANAKDLASLIEKCKSTHHFCVSGWHFHSGNFPNVTTSPAQSIALFHLYPYRELNDWAVSALKQVFVGHSEAGCNRSAKRLENRCEGGWLELDFAKYSKVAIASMLEITDPQKRKPQRTHHILLYDFNQVQSTLTELSRLYQIPVPSHLDVKHKQTRQKGSCSSEKQILAKFHECFDVGMSLPIP